MRAETELIRLDADFFDGVTVVDEEPSAALEEVSAAPACLTGASGLIANNDSVQLERSLKVS